MFLVYGNERQTTKLKKKLKVLDGRTDWTSPWELNDDCGSGSVTTLAPRHCGLAMPFCAVVATAALIGSALKAETPAAGTQEDAPNRHNMLVFGEKAIYLSHLPMFDGVTSNKTDYTSPHRYQVILEASFHSGAQNLQNIYGDDRRKNASVRIYTLNPEDFVLARLASGNPPLTGFKAKVFRGHLERGGRLVRGLDDVEVKVNRVVHFRKFNPQAGKPAELKYLLFGSAQETFLAHYISQPPDFDQVLSVKVEDHSFTDAELGKGIEVTIPGRPNQASERVQEAQQVTGLTQPTGARALKFKLEADKEIYFEEGELLVPPTFEDTKLKKKGIKSAPDKSSDARRKQRPSSKLAWLILCCLLPAYR